MNMGQNIFTELQQIKNLFLPQVRWN